MLTVLVVEDEASIAELLQDALRATDTGSSALPGHLTTL